MGLRRPRALQSVIVVSQVMQFNSPRVVSGEGEHYNLSTHGMMRESLLGVLSLYCRCPAIVVSVALSSALPLQRLADESSGNGHAIQPDLAVPVTSLVPRLARRGAVRAPV